MIGIINYGMGNLGSVQNSLDFLEKESTIFDQPTDIGKFDKLILPGVGAFGQAMNNLNNSGFADAIREQVDKGKPLIGICLGMQLMLEESNEHGHHKGLGLLKGSVRNLEEKISEHPTPHMGWNTLLPQKESLLLKAFPEEELIYYFVHGFYCAATDRSAVAATVSYGFEFDAVYEQGHLFATQFHPEKSQRSGLHILKQFAEL